MKPVRYSSGRSLAPQQAHGPLAKRSRQISASERKTRVLGTRILREERVADFGGFVGNCGLVEGSALQD